jgi:hypothetical protein
MQETESKPTLCSHVQRQCRHWVQKAEAQAVVHLRYMAGELLLILFISINDYLFNVLSLQVGHGMIMYSEASASATKIMLTEEFKIDLKKVPKIFEIFVSCNT